MSNDKPFGGRGIGATYGKLKGCVWFAPGLDLTAPADPELAAYLDEKDEKYGAASCGDDRSRGRAALPSEQNRRGPSQA